METLRLSRIVLVFGVGAGVERSSCPPTARALGRECAKKIIGAINNICARSLVVISYGNADTTFSRGGKRGSFGCSHIQYWGTLINVFVFVFVFRRSNRCYMVQFRIRLFQRLKVE